MAKAILAPSALIRNKRIGNLNRSHGMSKTRTYRIWCGMWKRCTDKTCTHYERYGGRGISVCERWRDFSLFYADMGAVPDGCSIDRFPNNDGNYEPGNCRWATRVQQARNTRTNRVMSLNGESLTLVEWAERAGVTLNAMHLRLKKGWSLAEAVAGRRTVHLRNPAAKITEEVVRRIRNRLAEGAPTRVVATEFGLSRSQVRNIKDKKHWGWV